MPGWVIKRDRIFAAIGFFQNRAIQLRDRRFELVEQLQKFFAPPAGPRQQARPAQFRAAFFGEQLFLAAQSLTHGQRVQLVAQHRAHAHQLVTMPEQLPQVAFGRRGNPDFRKAFRQQQIENQRGVAFIGLLLAHFAGANLGGVSDPKFVTEFRQQPLEPVNRPGRFDPHAHRPLQIPVERVRFAALVIQPSLDSTPR